ncbi:tyrosine-type recombinase/integrase [Streptomyces virginiae]|uniref:tyrosine-type recombinase/integrase n=1 Tax=Streptomyces sp. NBC_01233 TaxID=2903787 RepID=UPI002E0EFBB1|nr:tyrosine-type recombinase/integrase [Streptomyces sp. NBC_01233]
MVNSPRHRPGAELATAPNRAEDAYARLRGQLGTVAPRDPVSNRLGPRRDRLELLAEVCDRETFVLVADWLSSTAVKTVDSKRNYADDVRHWAAVVIEDGHPGFTLDAVTPGLIRTWRLSEEERGRSAGTINRRLSAVQSLADYRAHRDGRQPVRLVTRFDRPKEDRSAGAARATPVLEADELQRLMDACADAHETLAVLMTYTLAGRVSELCTADLSALQNRGRTCRLDLTRKGGKVRVFTLPPELCELLDDVLDGRTSGRLLLRADGRPYTRHDVDTMLTRLGHGARILTCPDAYTGRGRRPAGAEPRPRHSFRTCKRCRDVTPHVLRASKLTHMHDQGVPLEEIQQYADHADPATTLGYIRQRDDEAVKARNAQASVNLYQHVLDRWLRPDETAGAAR